MKNLFLTILFLFSNLLLLNAQTFETSFSRAMSGEYCGQEGFKFTFQNNVLTKTDLYYGSSRQIPSRRESTDFDKRGYYIEIWSPKYYLETYGIDEYYRVPHNGYRLCFDRKGGSLIYIFETDENSGIENGKFYFTQLGKSLFCQN